MATRANAPREAFASGVGPPLPAGGAGIRHPRTYACPGRLSTAQVVAYALLTITFSAFCAAASPKTSYACGN